MGNFKSQIDLFQSGGEFLFKRMCTLEEWNIDAAPDPFTKFSFAQELAKGKLGGDCWRSLTSIINHQYNLQMYLIPSPNIGLGV